MRELGKEIIFNSISMTKGKEYKNTKLLNKQAMCLKNLKTLLDDTYFDKFFEEIAGNRNTAHYVNENLFPSDCSMVGRYREAGFSQNLKYEIRWNFKVFDCCAELLNAFIELKEKYDVLILKGKYQDALQLLKKANEEYGCSLWYLENYIFLKKVLGEKDTFDPGRNFISSLVNFWEMRSASEVSSRDYDYYVKREIAKYVNVYPEQVSLASFYTYLIAPHAFEMTETSIMHILEYMYKMPLIDRYLFFIDILEYALMQDAQCELRKSVVEYAHYLEKIKDGYVSTFLFVTSNSVDRKRFKVELSNVEIKDMFVEGRLLEAYNISKSLLKNNPENIDNINLYVELAQILDADMELDSLPQNVALIIRALSSIFSIDDSYNDSIDKIYKIIFSCIHAKWARKLFNGITKTCQPVDSPSQITATRYFCFGELGIETVCEWLSSDDALDYFTSAQLPKSSYLEMRINCLKQNFAETVSNSKNENLNKLLLLENCYDVSIFKDMLEDKSISAIYLNRMVKIFWRNMKKGEYFVEGIDYFLKRFFTREEYAIIAPLEEFLDFVLSGEMKEKAELRTPILLYIYSAYFDRKKTSDLTIVCEDFFYFNKIERPSEMDIQDEKYDNEQFIFFLRYVCIPQILGPVLLSLRSAKELDKERINICQYLMQIDPDNEKEYAQEIQEITQKLVVNEGLVSIDNSKIHVNTNGIKSQISKNLRSDFNNYMYYRNHTLNPIMEKLREIEGFEKYSFITSDSVQLFEEIVRTIRNEFVSGGEYGLDGYLSINIRHGTLEGEIKAPLAKYDLLTPYLTEKQQYDVNSRWLFKIKDAVDAGHARDAIVELNQEVENIIKYLKNKLIQVSTEEKPTEGIFDYSLSSTNIQYLQRFIAEDTTFEQFIDIVFEYLWQMTEYNLEKMQNLIRNEISQRFVAEFSKLAQIYKAIDAKVEFPEALRWLNEVQTDVDNALNRIGLWFRRSSESKPADFELDLAFQMGLQMIKNIHPEKQFEVVELKKEIYHPIAGDFLKNYRDIFYTLFDNVSAYALPIQGIIRVWCELKIEGNYVLIKMSNDCDCSYDIDKRQKKLDSELQLLGKPGYLAKAKQEGGSGIPKIYKVMSVDLGKLTEINYAYDTINDKFSITIEGKR